MMKILLLVVITITISTVYARLRKYIVEKTVELHETVEFDSFKNDEQQLSFSSPAQFTDCGKTGSKFSVQMDPSVLRSDEPMTLTWDIVSPCDLNMGNANIKLFYQNDPAHALYDVDRQASCNQVHMFMPEINCPIKKGAELKGKYGAPVSLGPMIKGKFILAVNITNESKEVFACGKVNFEIA